MSSDPRTLLQDAVDRVPSHTGDLQAVERRARQRTRHARAGAAAGVVALTLVMAGLVRLPADRPPVIDQGTEAVQLDVQLCIPQRCPDTQMAVEEAADAVEEIPGVTSVEVVDVETRRQQMAEASAAPPAMIQDDLVAPALIVRVGDAAELAAVAGRVSERIPRATVHRGPVATEISDTDPYGDAPASGPATTVATLDVGGSQLDVRMWPVAGGGRCIAIGDLEDCGADRLVDGTVPLVEAAWGRPVADATCAWMPASPDAESVQVEFADGTTVDGVVAAAPPGLVTGSQVACIDAPTHPTAIATHMTGGAGTRAEGFAPYTEVRPAGVVGWREISRWLESALSREEARDLAALEDIGARLGRVDDALRGLASREGIDDVEVTDRGTGAYPDLPMIETTQVAATVTVAGGDPVCVVALLSEDLDVTPLRADRPAFWTPARGCPPLP